MESGMVKIEPYEIYYEKRGRGDHIVLMTGGTLGTTETTFLEQYKGLNQDKFTLISWDQPGYGRSLPRNQNFVNHYREFAKIGATLMKELGYEKYSLIGFCGGGRISLILAATNGPIIQKAVIMSSNAYVADYDRDNMLKFEDVNTWNKGRREIFDNIYGNDSKVFGRIMW